MVLTTVKSAGWLVVIIASLYSTRNGRAFVRVCVCACVNSKSTLGTSSALAQSGRSVGRLYCHFLVPRSSFGFRHSAVGPHFVDAKATTTPTHERHQIGGGGGGGGGVCFFQELELNETVATHRSFAFLSKLLIFFFLSFLLFFVCLFVAKRRATTTCSDHWRWEDQFDQWTTHRRQ